MRREDGRSVEGDCRRAVMFSLSTPTCIIDGLSRIGFPSAVLPSSRPRLHMLTCSRRSTLHNFLDLFSASGACNDQNRPCLVHAYAYRFKVSSAGRATTSPREQTETRRLAIRRMKACIAALVLHRCKRMRHGRYSWSRASECKEEMPLRTIIAVVDLVS